MGETLASAKELMPRGRESSNVSQLQSITALLNCQSSFSSHVVGKFMCITMHLWMNLFLYCVAYTNTASRCRDSPSLHSPSTKRPDRVRVDPSAWSVLLSVMSVDSRWIWLGNCFIALSAYVCT